jgi:DNA-binding CsgD family transcriptional regulator
VHRREARWRRLTEEDRVKKLDPIAVVEACYCSESDDVAWSKGILEALAPLSPGLGMYSFAVDLRGPTVDWTPLAELGDIGDWRASLAATHALPIEANRVMYQPSPAVDTMAHRLRKMDPATVEAGRRMSKATLGLENALGVTAALHDGRMVILAVGVPWDWPLAPRTNHQLTRVSAHLASAWRLRNRTREMSGPRLGEPDAVLAPSGRVLDAVPGARSPNVTERLVEAVRRAEHARGSLRRADPGEALDAWQGLVSGRWTLVDRTERDGRRFVLARRNDPAVSDPKALTPSERDVVAHARLGHSNKYIAYLLGLAPSTVATHLESARKKLGARSRRELMELLAGRQR